MNSVARMLLLVLLLAPNVTSAQDSASLRNLEGRKVRLMVAIPDIDGEQASMLYNARVALVRGDSIHIVQDGDRSARIPISHIRTLDVSRGKDRWAGARRGGMLGTSVGMLAAILSPIDCDGERQSTDCRPNGGRRSNLRNTWHYIPISTFVGALVGAAFSPERWQRVIERPRAWVAPRGGGFGLGFSF
jgi:hypothetical protein